MTAPPARLHGIATAYPPHVLDQDDVVETAAHIFARRPEVFRRMVGAYGNAGVRTRRSCVPIEWYRQQHGWPERARLYEEHALALLTEAARACCADAGIDAREVAATVTVSSTGIVTPSLDSLLQGPLGLDPGVQRLPVFGLGCCGGVTGLARAAAIAGSMPGRWVLFLCVELCGLTFRSVDDRKANVIATAIFGDGAAALLLKADDDPGRVSVAAWGEHTWPDSRDIMGWTVEDDGLGVVFSRDIPALVRRDLEPVADAFLARHGLGFADLDGVLCHPGGEKVLLAIQETFDLPSDGLRHARAVLAEKGNMSAVTVLAVLEQALAAGDRGRHLMMALGPGFSAGFALLDLTP